MFIVDTYRLSEHDGAQIKLEGDTRDPRLCLQAGAPWRPGTRRRSLWVRRGARRLFADLYSGKIVAALDRQHPRDLFDVRDLLANEGISDDLRRAFLVYVLSHNRPMVEILAPQRKDVRREFESGFVGMTEEPVELESLYEARENLISGGVGGMPAAHRQFLLSFKEGQPDWGLLGLPDAAKLPAVRWKAENLAKLAPGKRKSLVEALSRVLRR